MGNPSGPPANGEGFGADEEGALEAVRWEVDAADDGAGLAAGALEEEGAPEDKEVVEAAEKMREGLGGAKSAYSS